MKQFPVRPAALAVAAAAVLAFAAGIRTQTTASAAARFYPVSSDFTVRRAERYAMLPDNSSVKAMLKGKLGFEVAGSSGLYRNYQILYTEPCGSASGYSENAVIMYDPALRPALEAVSDEKLHQWMEPFLQFINTEKEISGVSRGCLITILDAAETEDRSDARRGDPVTDSNWNYSAPEVSSLGSYESNETEDAITAFDTPFMPWGMLHETSHAYVNDAQSPFLTSDEIFTNLRLLCTVRSLNRNGVTFPEILRQNKRGTLRSERAVYISSTALQYACRDMQDERSSRFLGRSPGSFRNAKNGSDLFFARLGIMFGTGSGMSPWNPMICTDRAFADRIETDSSLDACWNKLYALCISEPEHVDLSKVPFMLKPKSLYENYIIKQFYNYDYDEMRPKTIRVNTLYDSAQAEQRVTANVEYAVERRYCYNTVCGQRIWKCTSGTLHALNTMDFLFGEQSAEGFNNRLNLLVSGNRRVTYFTVADEIAYAA